MNKEEINYDLEKMLRKISKIAKEKQVAIQSREKRKLRIKEKKLPLKSIVKEDEV